MLKANRKIRWALTALGLSTFDIGTCSADASPQHQIEAPTEAIHYAPPALSRRPTSFWWPAVIVEQASHRHDLPTTDDDTRIGVSIAHRGAWFSPHVRVASSPGPAAYQNLALLGGLGARAHFDTLGIPLSYGFGAHWETRLRDSLWLTYATIAEVGIPLYRRGSAEFFVFIGLRRSIYGELINSYLLDPNGFDNENAADALDALERVTPWQVYATFTFGRRVD